MHAPLVDADLGRPLDGGFLLGRGRQRRFVLEPPGNFHMIRVLGPTLHDGECA